MKDPTSPHSGLIAMIDEALDKNQLNGETENTIKRKAAKMGIHPTKLGELILERTRLRNQQNLRGPKQRIRQSIAPQHLKMGQHIRLDTIDDDLGRSREELVYMGENCFFLLHHNAGVLNLGDFLISHTAPWQVDFKCDFSVYRGKKQLLGPTGESIYRTRRITEISIMDY